MAESKRFCRCASGYYNATTFPQAEQHAIDEVDEQQISWLKEIIVAVRNIRAESSIAPSKELDSLLRNISDDKQICLESNRTSY